MSKVLALDELRQLSEKLKQEGKKLVTTNGCFDILHVGHARILAEARKLGDVLVVGLNSDDSVKRLKGESRPINNQADRAEMLTHLRSVDYVYIFSEDTPVEFLQAARPMIHVKGADYTKEKLAETPVVEAFGGEVRLLSLVPAKSTTSVVEKIKQG
ncbi:MAG: D-glycero-beta-D-manno-heptose 1-phosphate adenylyltransferase [Candidatus Obscuribacterales bacterium]|nr:D-glycero-beta-D-manno-heptose 1-phosphate adenylyltransferase [Candidatus Obscuribacterales bacterium]